MATVLAHDPQVDPVVLQHHPMRNALTNVVGARPRTDVHVVEEALAGGEPLLLTTDGIHGVLDDHRLERLMQEDGEPREVVPEQSSPPRSREAAATTARRSWRAIRANNGSL